VRLRPCVRRPLKCFMLAALLTHGCWGRCTPQAVSAGPRARGNFGRTRCVLWGRSDGLSGAHQTSLRTRRIVFAGKEMEAKWEQNSQYFIFFITFMAVITIGSKFLPKTKPQKEIIGKRAAKEAQLKEARPTPTRVRTRAHTRRPTYARACTQEHAHVCLITIIPLPPFSPFAGKKEKKLALNPKS